eukprot:GDKI01025524.1.p1 GENE.GDKI01025524.1~~GDKI01025524.1.p1  ORF type:complete len:187 (+),score=52.30 GDKI01025524.1:121-681(+)
MCVLVLDGTWQQAKKLNYLIPKHIPRVRLDTQVVSGFLLRKQSSAGRICTAEATALMFQELAAVQDQRSLAAKIENVSLRTDETTSDTCARAETPGSEPDGQAYAYVAKLIFESLQVLVDTMLAQTGKKDMKEKLQQINQERTLQPLPPSLTYAHKDKQQAQTNTQEGQGVYVTENTPVTVASESM